MRVYLVIFRANRKDTGTMMQNTSVRVGFIIIIISREPVTVMTPVSRWTRSVEKQLLMLSIS